MPVEAMATGTPVVATTIGGAAESVVHGVTGTLTDFDSSSDLKAAINLAVSLTKSACVGRAFEFDRPSFKNRTLEWIPDEFHEN